MQVPTFLEDAATAFILKFRTSDFLKDKHDIHFCKYQYLNICNT